ncbi:hypothetical protein AAF712_008574 [Marasmius tenuissimus]|uniref:Uncharacterized protein n=1 Tax=Marasmius tenuissimus TaxID=585030 RepID=A0ABR2ZTQ8_9AGAR
MSVPTPNQGITPGIVIEKIARRLAFCTPGPNPKPKPSPGSRSNTFDATVTNTIKLKHLPPAKLSLPPHVSNPNCTFNVAELKAKYMANCNADNPPNNSDGAIAFWQNLLKFDNPDPFLEARFIFRGMDTDDGKEHWAMAALDQLAETVLSLIQLELLILWEEDFGPLSVDALEMIQRLGVRAQQRQFGMIPDVQLLLLPGGGDEDAVVLATVDAKSSGLALYGYKVPGGVQTKDSYIERLRDQGASQAGEAGWKLEANWLLAQMYHYSHNSKSGLTFFTSVRGFTRWGFHLKLNTLMLSGNLTPPNDDVHAAKLPATYLPFVTKLHDFMFWAIISTTQEVLPPSKRHEIDFRALLPAQLSIPNPLSRVQRLLERSHLMVSSVLVSCLPFLMRKIYSFTSPQVHGRYENLQNGAMRFLKLRLDFPLQIKTEWNRVMINPQLGLVLKEFSVNDTFEAEKTAYEKLAGSNAIAIPKIHGTFVNSWTGKSCIMSEFVGHTLEKEGSGALSQRD